MLIVLPMHAPIITWTHFLRQAGSSYVNDTSLGPRVLAAPPKEMYNLFKSTLRVINNVTITHGMYIIQQQHPPIELKNIEGH